ncbi:MAG: OmpA family protein [Deltaproteobacteria bacterium HGW-Deltaproteobacteria-3]|nr:MAG: OmpA family protein [Deltaproteobacteria bacterium HGW-Deltaproteobacteria-3]
MRSFIAIGLVFFLAGCVTTGSNGVNPDYDQAKKSAVKVTQTTRGAQITSDERILFDTGKSEIKSDGMVFIDRVVKILKEKTKANVLVEGHTDSVGGAEYNQNLSTRRANAVKQAFVAKGLPAARIQAQGLGMNKPVADNATPDGRQANRRTEIIVLGESVENIGGTSLADQLAEGLDRFLKDASGFIKNVFGGKKDE